MCPCLGATRKLDIVMTAVATSNLPREMAHCSAPMRDWYFAMSSCPRRGESSNSGWSFFSSGEEHFWGGALPKSFLYWSYIRSMYFRGPKHKVPWLSRKKSHPRWKVTGPVPFSLKLLGLEVRASMIPFGSLDAIARSSTYLAMYS